MKRLQIFLLVEGLILLALAFRLFVHRPGFLPMLVFALLFSFLVTNSRRRITLQIFGVLALFFWLFVIVFVISTGYFWLAIIWPIIFFLFIFRNERPFFTREKKEPVQEKTSSGPKDITDEGSDVTIEPDEIIDLSTIDYKPGGNLISIKKTIGNTIVLVPNSIGLALEVTTEKGLVRIFENMPVLDGENIRFMTDNFEAHEKRVTLSIRTNQGNIEVKHK